MLSWSGVQLKDSGDDGEGVRVHVELDRMNLGRSLSVLLEASRTTLLGTLEMRCM